MRIRPALVLLACLSLTGAALTAADPPRAMAEPPVPSTGEAGGPAVPVGLITGDTVLLHPDGSVGFRPGDGREHVGYTRTFASDGSGEVLVVPADAAPELAAGRLDPRLFNVSRLAADGLGRAGTLPLIVEGGSGERRRPGVEEATMTLETIGAEAVTISTVDGGWWSSLISARRGVEHVWLDGASRVALDVSVPQVGAPEAWSAGYDGEGVTVAVLDSGYDPAHPDLGGVGEAVDFTGSSPEALDGHGHGTHVASIVAGTGAASGGGYTGVAPGADLMVGKVCGDDGFCDDSAVIAGMEWAAHEGADVVNISIGGYPSDGTGPVEQALNMLTEHTGTLFVVSAGNYGAPNSIGSPGAADAALTVGSVEKSDVLSASSSRGPRSGDGAVKPDITAPGGGIVAARASGTSMGTPVGEHYTAESGTSMASPHVAGGAALLKQAHPDWTAERLKAALMGAARPLDGHTVYEQGTGRLDLARAVTGPLSTTVGGLSFGLYAWPHEQPAQTRTITYANSGDAPLTLALTVTGANADGTAIPAGLFTLDAANVTVPAGGTVDVALTLHPSADDALGLISAVLTATDGAHTARTALGLNLERELHTLTLTPKARPGDRLDGIDAAWANLDTGESGYITTWGEGYVGTARLSPGRYQVYGTVRTEGTQRRLTAFDTRVTVAGSDTSTTWDTAKGVPSKVTLDRAASFSEANVTLSFGSIGIGANTTGAVHVVSAGSAPKTSLRYSYQPVLRAVSGTRTTHVYTLYFPSTGGLPAGPVYTARDRDLSREHAVYHSQGATGLKGSRLNQVTAAPDGLSGFASITEVAWPSERVEFFSLHPGLTWGGFAFVGDGQNFEQLFWAGERTLTPQTVHWNEAPLGAGVGGPENSGGAWLHHGGHLAIWMPMFTGSDPNVRANYEGPLVTGTTRLRDPHGMEVLSTEQPCIGGVVVDAMAHGSHILDCTAERDVPWSVLGTKTTATWTFTVPHHRMDGTPVALNAVRIDSPNIRDGFVPAGQRQDLTLDVYRQPGTPATTATKLRFEVSYDDGATWRTVTVSRVGDHATASLKHPAGAKFVSTRVSATDASGASVTATTIRAWGLA